MHPAMIAVPVLMNPFLPEGGLKRSLALHIVLLHPIIRSEDDKAPREHGTRRFQARVYLIIMTRSTKKREIHLVRGTGPVYDEDT
jgi:hypothetical protein